MIVISEKQTKMLDNAILVYTFSIISTILISVSLLWKAVTSRYPFIYCPFNVPVFGSTLHLEKEPAKVTKQFIEFTVEANHLVKLWFSYKPVIFASTVEYAKTVLSSQKLLRKSFFYIFFSKWLNTGLLTSYGKKWKLRRRIITPAFHFFILNQFANTFEKHALALIDRLKQLSDKHEATDIQKEVSLTMLDAMCETSMGVDVSGDEAGIKYVERIGCLNRQLQLRQRTPYLWPDFIYGYTSYGKAFYESLKYVQEYTIDVINRRIAVRNKESHIKTDYVDDGKSCTEKRKGDICFIDILLDSYKTGDIDIDGIREEVDTIIFEGHDTTSTAISFCLYLLGRHPEHLKTLQDEIYNAKGGNILEKIKNMQFLDLCLKEALRLYPPVPIIGRELEEDTVIDGHTIYKNTDVAISIVTLHRNEKYWEDPLKFNPYRFTEENIKKRDPFCYVPFSAGPRNCVGQRFALFEAKITIFYILKEFSLKSVQKEEDLEICVEIIMKSQNGLLIEFTKRQKI